jgi:hypothetical protein
VLANGLCCLATGAGSAYRTLYSDADETMTSVARPILLNGINDVVKRPDLLDRSVAVVLDPIPDSARKTEAEVDAAFQAAQPAILGKVLDAVACALKHEATTRPDCLPRMADFAITVTAAEKALGWEPGWFLEAYTDTRTVAIEGLLEGDPVAAALQKLPLPWNGKAQGLLKVLADGLTDTERDQLPKTAKAVANRLRELAPGLRQIGVDVQFQKGHSRTIAIRRTSAASATGPRPVTLQAA